MPEESEPTKAATDATAPEPTLDADGRERPRFVLSFPDDAELQALVRLFERGDFHALSVEAPKLAQRTADPSVRAACEELLRRTRPDETVKLLLALALAFFAFLVVWTYW
jgi:hypothetical protein